MGGQCDTERNHKYNEVQYKSVSTHQQPLPALYWLTACLVCIRVSVLTLCLPTVWLNKACCVFLAKQALVCIL